MLVRNTSRSGVAVLLSLASCVTLFAADVGRGPISSAADYQTWIDLYGHKDLTGQSFDKPTRLQLVVTVVTGESETEVKDIHERHRPGIRIFGCELTIDGYAQSFSETDYARRSGGSDERMPASDLARLKQMLEQLPDDGSRLPPPNRRMLIQTADGRARVYDRANAPEKIWEILRVSGCGPGSWVPQYKPKVTVRARNVELGGFLSLIPETRQIVFTWSSGPLQFWDSTTHKLLAEVGKGRTYGEQLVFSPDGKLAVMAGWGDCTVLDPKTWNQTHLFPGPVVNGSKESLYAPQFVRNGRYLILHSSAPALRLIDVATWTRVDQINEVPSKAVQYFPSPSGTLAIVRLRSGDIGLWDVNDQHEIAKLSLGRWVSRCAFAPNESSVATITTGRLAEGHPRTDLTIETWNTKTGARIHQFRPYEVASVETAEGLAWSPDGRYLLVATNSNGGTTAIGINVFNASSGRHCGELVGCPSHLNGMVVASESSQLVVGCEDGRIRFWNIRDDLKQIAAFEESMVR